MPKFNKMQKILLICISFLGFYPFLISQELVKNSDKEWVLIYKDGTFRRLDFDNNDDIYLFEDKIAKDSSLQQFEYDEDKFYYVKTYVMNEKCNYLFYNNEIEYQDATKNKQIIEQEFNFANQEKNNIEIKRLKKLLSESNKSLQNLYKKKIELEKKCNEYNSILNTSSKKRKEILTKSYNIKYKGSQINPYHEISELKFESTPTTNEPNLETKKDSLSKELPKTIEIVKFRHDDVYKNPPFHKYKIVVDTFDSFTKKNRLELEDDLLFSYTDENLKNFQKLRDYIICHAYITKIPGFLTLNLEININSINTSTQFGTIEKGSYLLVKLINGENIKLFCNRSDKGLLNPVDGVTLYRTTYIIDKDAESSLKKYEVDKIRLIWSTGYDEYDITNMDFFINQIKSLN